MGNRFVTNDGLVGETQPDDVDLQYSVARTRWETENAPQKAKVRRSQSNATLPTRAYQGDAGYDLYYTGEGDTLIAPGEVVWLPSAVAIQWPDGFWGLIIGRSSSFEKGLLVNPTVIDAGFRGNLGAYVRNINTDWVTVQPNDRVAQIVPMALFGFQLVEVDELDESDRGSNGFGSSGR